MIYEQITFVFIILDFVENIPKAKDSCLFSKIVNYDF